MVGISKFAEIHETVETAIQMMAWKKIDLISILNISAKKFRDVNTGIILVLYR